MLGPGTREERERRMARKYVVHKLRAVRVVRTNTVLTLPRGGIESREREEEVLVE